MKTGLGFLLVALAALAAWPIAGMAETKLKWAHVYEVAEPYHTEALWAAEEIKKRTNGKYQIDVFAASQLSNEDQRGIGARQSLCSRERSTDSKTPTIMAKKIL
jgi:TRAP-type C4-dicarboxylate transport system substrate-binding protein